MSLLDWLYPPLCAGCKARSTVLCGTCLTIVRERYERIQRCQRCDTPRTYGQCEVCREFANDVIGVKILGSYAHPLSTAIKQMKFHHRPYYAQDMGFLLSALILQDPSMQIDALIAVPMQRDHERARGYNPSALLVQSMAKKLHLPALMHVVTRTRQAPIQHTLSGVERRHNVIGLFACDAEQIRGKRVVIVDDVMTTGATMHAMAVALHLGGAAAIWGIALAHPTYRDHAKDQ